VRSKRPLKASTWVEQVLEPKCLGLGNTGGDYGQRVKAHWECVYVAQMHLGPRAEICYSESTTFSPFDLSFDITTQQRGTQYSLAASTLCRESPMLKQARFPSRTGNKTRDELLYLKIGDQKICESYFALVAFAKLIASCSSVDAKALLL
jgi:hypothetical protein